MSCIRRSKKKSKQSEHAELDTDAEHGDLDDYEANPRFVYQPKHFHQRVIVSLGAKTKLMSTTSVQLGFSRTLKWGLITVLLLITVFLTPALLPKWLGFKWSTPSDLCKNRQQKLDRLRLKMENLSHIPEGRQFVQKASDSLKCMNDSSAQFWTGTGRVKYPTECIPANAEAETKQIKSCIEPVCTEACLRFLFIKRLACKKKCTKRKCTTVTAADPDSERKIAELNSRRQNFLNEDNVNTTKQTAKEIQGTADKTAETIINRLVWQIDIASSAYIVYTLLAIIFGQPIIVQKQNIGNRCCSFLFGFRKSTFMVAVIIFLTVFDAAQKIFFDTNFPLILKNFRNDACYLDPNFSAARLKMIQYTCANVTEQKAALESTFANMTRVLYDASLCEVCRVESRGQHRYPALIANIDSERKQYSTGNITGYIHTASCNSTLLNEATAAAPDTGLSFAEAFLGSGILAQILLKAVLSSWLVHLVAFIDPMLLHRGRVEVFGLREGSSAGLSKSESEAIRRFARDKHLLPLLFFLLCMVWEVVIIVYSMVQKYTNTSNILSDIAVDTVPLVANITASCAQGKLIFPQNTSTVI